MKRLLRFLLTPFKAYIDAYEKAMKEWLEEVMELGEPYRSMTLIDMLRDNDYPYLGY